MGFLEALGRAKPADDILGAVGKYANIQQTNASTENVKAATALSAENLEMAKIKRNQEQFQLKKLQEQEAFDNQVTPIDSHPFFKNISTVAPNTYKQVLEMSEGLGFVSPLAGSNQKVISNKNFNMFQEHLTKNPKEMQSLMGSGIDELTTQMSQLEEQAKQIPQDKNGQAALAQLQQQWNQLNNAKIRLTNDATALEKHIAQEDYDTANKMKIESAKQLTSLSNYEKKKQIAQKYPAPVNPASAEYKDLAIDMKVLNEFGKKEESLNKRLVVKQEDKDALAKEKEKLQPVYDRVIKKLGLLQGEEPTKAITQNDVSAVTKTMKSLVDKKASDKQIYEGTKKKLISMGYSQEQADNTIKEAWRNLKGKK